MNGFIPNYKNMEKTAMNIKPDRMPVYEHLISVTIMEKIMNKKFEQLYDGNESDRLEYFRNYTNFFKQMNYDTVSFECCIGGIMPGSGALGGHIPGVIKNRADFQKYPWQEIPDLFYDKFSSDFKLLRKVMPEGMKAVGGPGNGVFECVQDLVGYTELCYMGFDDPQLYKDMFSTVGDVMFKIWARFLDEFSDIYTVCRFGDDLGFKSQTLISVDDIKTNVLPQYKKIVKIVHDYNKPFLLHSCGKIFDIMEDLINDVGIDAKHSNEDIIAPFSVWVDKYGDRIGNFGGVDLDILCENDETLVKKYVKNIIDESIEHKGFALGSGNSIPDYVPVEGYLAMIEQANESRGV